ncbi:MAG: ABC transporter ATP-binding protein [Alphaproteobacteria bacterium]
MADLKLTGLKKRYGPVQAVRGVDLEIPAGEFAVLVGPSGCGKSTLLRTIAGLEEADEGTIEIAGRVVNHDRPRDRDIAMVFQNYALYPFMSVYENIAFGLRARRTPAAEIDTRVKRAADMLGIVELLDRLPRQLSGGQRQRVAIGRAIVRNARLFLFDEPLSNLDAQLRDEMRGEIKRLHQEIVGTTMIYVTHDQVEAMTLADRIVLLKDGLIEQVGPPLDLFERPATRFVAGFLGSPRMNFMAVRAVAVGAVLSLRFATGATIPWPAHRPVPGTPGERDLILGLRPEHMTRAGAAGARDGHVRVAVTVELIQPTGSRTYVTVDLFGAHVMVEVGSHDIQRPGERVEIDLDMGRAVLIDPASDRVIA